MTRDRRSFLAATLLAVVCISSVVSGHSASAAATWTARANDATRHWVSLFSSDDGTKLFGTVENGTLMRSSDSGVTWTPVSSLGNKNWISVFGTPDGQKVMATVGRGPVYLSNDEIGRAHV